MSGAVLTERQRKWFATVHANLEKNTGKPLAEWVVIMKTCPETQVKAQLAWLKTNHGVGQNHGVHILNAWRPGGGPGWDAPDELRALLWKDAASAAILTRLEAVAAADSTVVTGYRKNFASFSRNVQFAATRPLKGGRALLGLKLEPDASPRLSPSIRQESWSERLTAVVELDTAEQVDTEIARLFALAAERG